MYDHIIVYIHYTPEIYALGYRGAVLIREKGE